MTPDLQNLRRLQPNHKTKPVKAEQLADALFGGNREEAYLHIRALSANEIYLAKQNIESSTPLKMLGKGLAAANQTDVSEALKQVFGVSAQDATAMDYTYRFYMMLYAVIDPDTQKQLFDFEDVARIAEYWPATFMLVTNEIISLSGEGPDVGEG
jgi:hypothetical protein